DDRRNVVAIKHFVDRQPQDVAIERRDTLEFVILAVTPDAFVNFLEMHHHPFYKWLRKLADTSCCRAKFPEIADLLRPITVLKVAPEMILDGRFACLSPFAHKIIFCEVLTSRQQFRPRPARPRSRG